MDLIVITNPKPFIGKSYPSDKFSQLSSNVFFLVMSLVLFFIMYFVFPHIDKTSYKILLAVCSLLTLSTYVIASQSSPGYLKTWPL